MGVIADARARQRRGRRYALLAMLLLAAVAVVVTAAAPGDGAHGSGAAAHAYRVSELDLSTVDRYEQIARVGARLVLTGQTVTGHGGRTCHVAVLDPVHLTLSQVRSGSCADPAMAGERVLALESVEHNSLPRGGGVATETVRIAHVRRSAPGYTLGPAVMTFPQESTAYPGWVDDRGSLWLYDGAAQRSSDLLRISATTGAVLQRLTIPRLPRPLLAADEDGLWIAPSVNGAGHEVYHVAPGASEATATFSLPGPRYAAWMLAAGRDLWLDVHSPTGADTLWRLVGPAARRTSYVPVSARALDGEVEAQGGGSVVVGDGADGLWTAIAQPSHDVQRVVRINAATGALTTVATITPGYGAANAVADGGPVSAVTLDRSMFLLDPPQRRRDLPVQADRVQRAVSRCPARVIRRRTGRPRPSRALERRLSRPRPPRSRSASAVRSGR